MVTLSGILTRRRWWVVGAWLVTVAVAAPMAAKQTEHLSGGGFDVPGSQSQAVETALTKHLPRTRLGGSPWFSSRLPMRRPSRRARRFAGRARR